ncbi:Jjj2p NDAI_0B00200 [Naumovozyma dairenensis CBS 421]|uniref:J domain-containing protein n=1 Tax=Naumovozyma dairenensis (strain ATCC 10597 / BCRC 20456 / CBS 421 / NBRC 0211 / NRRL Y-12639) TaxID=1071378 RepID=G0W5J3_NAUDC|nr:hypothetical protein NDAI_0B00200 [Naumovozyma dairenensis CBS 421]CCD23054.1 hypothetical protein NDAI_0B00200 [Naumovozyma dairenensis CBS 421]
MNLPENMEDIDIKLDETTYYSILGLHPQATDNEIRKSYMKFARKLHPDKSKSDTCAELFKLVVHAHSILTDKELKLEYDRELIRKGLNNYSPKSNIGELLINNKTGNTNDHKDHYDHQVPKFTRKSKPYEQQPYGFEGKYNNTKSTTNGGKKTARKKSEEKSFKKFNVKSYQQSKYTDTNKDRPYEDKHHRTLNTDTDQRHFPYHYKYHHAHTQDNDYRNTQLDENDEIKHRASSIPSYLQADDSLSPDELSFQRNNYTGNKNSSGNSDDDSNVRPTSEQSNDTAARISEDLEDHTIPTNLTSNEGYNTKRDDLDDDQDRPGRQQKMHKTNSTSNVPKSPFFPTKESRHYARTRFMNANDRRRSISPFKNPSTKTSLFDLNDHWDTLKRVIDMFNEENKREDEAYNIKTLSIDDEDTGYNTSSMNDSTSVNFNTSNDTGVHDKFNYSTNPSKRRKTESNTYNNASDDTSFDMAFFEHNLNSILIQDDNENHEDIMTNLHSIKIPQLRISDNSNSILSRREIEKYIDNGNRMKQFFLRVLVARQSTVPNASCLLDRRAFQEYMEQQNIQLNVINKLAELEYSLCLGLQRYHDSLQ